MSRSDSTSLTNPLGLLGNTPDTVALHSAIDLFSSINFSEGIWKFITSSFGAILGVFMIFAAKWVSGNTDTMMTNARSFGWFICRLIFYKKNTYTLSNTDSDTKKVLEIIRGESYQLYHSLPVYHETVNDKIVYVYTLRWIHDSYIVQVTKRVIDEIAERKRVEKFFKDTQLLSATRVGAKFGMLIEDPIVVYPCNNYLNVKEILTTSLALQHKIKAYIRLCFLVNGIPGLGNTTVETTGLGR